MPPRKTRKNLHVALLFLARHGQASFGTADYDRLSDLGRQQSRWLGEYFAERDLKFTRVVAGTLRRQRETARELLSAMASSVPIDVHAGLDEYHGEALYAAYTNGRNPLDHQRSDYRDYWRTMKVDGHSVQKHDGINLLIKLDQHLTQAGPLSGALPDWAAAAST